MSRIFICKCVETQLFIWLNVTIVCSFVLWSYITLSRIILYQLYMYNIREILNKPCPMWHKQTIDQEGGSCSSHKCHQQQTFRVSIPICNNKEQKQTKTSWQHIGIILLSFCPVFASLGSGTFTYLNTACGPSDGKEVKDVLGRPGARVEVGSARVRPLAAHGVGTRQQVKIWKLDICPVTI